MNAIVLKSKNTQGEELEATFLPEKGMNLISYKKGDIEVIDQSTRDLFEERYAGLGALIGPHFHHRLAAVIPPIKDESLFPHIARVKAKGIHEPFSHGVGRYAPWNAQATPTTIKAKLSGKDTWNGVQLAAIEGQNFTMNMDVSLEPTGLKIILSVTSDTDSVVGLHYYYRLTEGRGKVISRIQDHYLDKEGFKLIPSTWNYSSQQELVFDLAKEADFTFYPYSNPLAGLITLQTDEYSLNVRYQSQCQENCWQLYHPQGASFVCIEPISAKDPRHPNLTASTIDVNLEIKGPSDD